MFKKAVVSESKLRLAIIGPSGSGKTYTALAIATALAPGSVAVIDTENGSASKYASVFDFDVAGMHAPYHPDKYIKAIQMAADAGYKVVVLDSLTHAWAGQGGVLELVDEAAKRMKSGNSYVAWKEGTAIQNKLNEAILNSGIHVVATMRSKQEYVQEKDNNGRTVIRKVGMAPIQRESTEYEYDIVLDMDIDNNAIVSKSRCSALSGRVLSKPGADVARILSEWLGGASVNEMQDPSKPTDTETQALWDDAPPIDQNGPAKLGAITKTQMGELHSLGTAFYNGAWDKQRPILVKSASKGATESSKDLTQVQAQKLIDGLQSRLAVRVIERAAAENIDLNDILPAHKVQTLDDASPVALTHIYRDVMDKAVETVPA